MCQFSWFASRLYFIQTWMTANYVPPGSPIRKSADHSLLGSYPRLIAACNVLHRLLAPRHPPSALTNLIELDARARYSVLKVPAPSFASEGGFRDIPWELNSVPVVRRNNSLGLGDGPLVSASTWEFGASAPISQARMALPLLLILLRKEVIQPHLPVRLPCYDFTPIADPTFDGSLPCGLGHRLRVLPTFVV